MSYEPRRSCGATTEVELADGTVVDLWCSQVAGHAEEHSCRIYWSRDD